ncbi:type III pantothenate kinase [Changchengzhania lutea]|uniref:type III pantothenate kinase n=1 Tax=Changchengzhania lutea TaxID=2049305 RepID=UPI00115DA4E9|nr:type III pantothenate kinase [Changchengzhania lutea]
MNLIIDVGNTFVKLAVFKESDLVYKDTVLIDDIRDRVDALNTKFPAITNAIISSVGRLGDTDYDFIAFHFKVLVLNSNTKLPFKNGYSTPTTLGNDRLALVAAAVHQYPNKHVLVIDAGTCITYDFITINADYLGGAISPGIKMRYESLHNLTANLPLLEAAVPHDIIGNSTNQSIHSGVVYGVLKEIEGVKEAYHQKYSDLTVILTGGDANFLSKQLKSSIFANSNFLLEGLNFILQFNSN